MQPVTAQDQHDNNNESTLIARITQDPTEIDMAMRLRYRVFAEGMGAKLPNAEHGLDKDRFDDVCLHLIVKDVIADTVVGYSRILTSDMVALTGGFYSETEFDLRNIILPGKKYMEIGRTCVDPEFRSGAVIGLLWSGIAQYMAANNVDYLMGCASIPLHNGYSQAIAIVDYLRENHFTPEHIRAEPRVHLPRTQVNLDGKKRVPPLIKAYLRIGFKVCGEPFYDKDFNVADALVLMASGDMNQRYLRHFVKTQG